MSALLRQFVYLGLLLALLYSPPRILNLRAETPIGLDFALFVAWLSMLLAPQNSRQAAGWTLTVISTLAIGFSWYGSFLPYEASFRLVHTLFPVALLCCSTATFVVMLKRRILDANARDSKPV